jgi:hypothetical protein
MLNKPRTIYWEFEMDMGDGNFSVLGGMIGVQ